MFQLDVVQLRKGECRSYPDLMDQVVRNGLAIRPHAPSGPAIRPDHRAPLAGPAADARAGGPGCRMLGARDLACGAGWDLAAPAGWHSGCRDASIAASAAAI